MGTVYKFGGSSVKDKEAMLKCAEIVRGCEDLSFVIISATYNTTNELEASVESPQVFLDLIQRHIDLAKSLNVYQFCENDIESLSKEGQLILERDVDAASMDQLYSIGERLSTSIFIHVLNSNGAQREFELIDARDLIKTDSQFGEATPAFERIYEKFQGLDSNCIYLTQGFIGSDDNGKTTTLGREGSDYSASIIANAINADEVVIWTDVPGVATTDPKKIDKALYLERLPYDLAILMSELGAKVLFKRTLYPCQRKAIPLRVCSTLEPDKKGTKIFNYDIENFPVVGIAISQDKKSISFIGREVNSKSFPQDFYESGENFVKYHYSEERYHQLHELLLEKLGHK